MSVRGSYSLDSQDRVFGDVRERGTRSTGFGEISLQGMHTRHTWVVGGAYQYDGYNARDLPRFDYAFNAPAIFAQDEFAAGAVRVSLSGRLDVHDEYGTLASPRGSLLWRPDAGMDCSRVRRWRCICADAIRRGHGRNRLVASRAARGPRSRTRVGRLPGCDTSGWRPRVDRDLLWLRCAEPGATHRRAPMACSCSSTPVVPTQTFGGEALGRYRSGPFLAIATYAFVQSRELDEESGLRREVPLTPRHYAALDVMYESEDWGRAGLEFYYVGHQSLDDNPYRTRGLGQFIVGALVEKRFERVRLFVNAENLGNVRQTKLRPARSSRAASRWSMDGRCVGAARRSSRQRRDPGLLLTGVRICQRTADQEPLMRAGLPTRSIALAFCLVLRASPSFAQTTRDASACSALTSLEDSRARSHDRQGRVVCGWLAAASRWSGCTRESDQAAGVLSSRRRDR